MVSTTTGIPREVPTAVDSVSCGGGEGRFWPKEREGNCRQDLTWYDQIEDSHKDVMLDVCHDNDI